MGIILLLMLPAGLSLCYWGVWARGKLIRLEHNRHYDNWVEDGCPQTMFDSPVPQSWSGGLATNRCGRKWTFITPDWMKRDKDACGWLWVWRIAPTAGLIVVLGWVLLLAITVEHGGSNRPSHHTVDSRADAAANGW